MVWQALPQNKKTPKKIQVVQGYHGGEDCRSSRSHFPSNRMPDMMVPKLPFSSFRAQFVCVDFSGSAGRVKE